MKTRFSYLAFAVIAAATLLVGLWEPSALAQTGVATNLAITSVNGGVNPVAGAAFEVVVQAQSADGAPANVVTDTTVTLNRSAGTGTLGGTLIGTLLAGSSSVTLSGITYTKAESGVGLTATATSGDILAAGNSAAFTVVAGPAATLTLTSGSGQSALARATLVNPFVVTVTDANGNPVSGTGVTFAITTVPGSATGQLLSVTDATTAANGQASSTLTLGDTFGIYTVTATSAGLAGSPVTFTANATANMAITSVNGGVSPAAGAAFSVVVQVRGASGAAVNVSADTTVSLSRTTGTGALGGTLTGTILAGSSSVTLSGVTYTKAESGVVLTATRTSGDTLTAGNSAAFTVVAGPAAALALTSGNNQTGVAGSALGSALVVTVQDANSNAVSGASVTFAVATAPAGASGQVLNPATATTTASGQASSSFTLGNVVGTYTVTATSGTLSGSPVTFTATATAKLAITSVNGGLNPTAGTPFSVVVQAQNAAAVAQTVSADTVVTLTRSSGTGNLGGTVTGTLLAGTSSVTISGVTYTKAESGVVLVATRTSGDAMAAGTSAAFTVNAGAAATLTLTSGNSQSQRRSWPLTNPFVVTATDVYANPVSAVPVSFAIVTVPAGATGQSLSTNTTTTAANGQASAKLTTGSVAGTYTVTATSAGLSGSPVTFTATATPGNYTMLAAATNEYQICFKCHSGYAWLPGSPPVGNSPNGTATSPVMTDVAQEFSPMNKSGHPVVTGLDNYPNSTAVSGKKGLLAAAMKAPWNVNMGTQTMLCSDCHDSTTTNYVASAAAGPHGSAYQFMLRGPNAANWPAVANTTAGFNSSWCANCHNNSSSTYHGGHHTGYQCYACHIVIPHGGKVSRLLGANGNGTLPARYTYNNTTSTMRLTGVTKTTATGYTSSSCGCSSEHGTTRGTERW